MIEGLKKICAKHLGGYELTESYDQSEWKSHAYSQGSFFPTAFDKEWGMDK